MSAPNSHTRVIASHLRDFAEFLPVEKREDFGATIDDLLESASDTRAPVAWAVVEPGTNDVISAFPDEQAAISARPSMDHDTIPLYAAPQVPDVREAPVNDRHINSSPAVAAPVARIEPVRDGPTVTTSTHPETACVVGAPVAWLYRRRVSGVETVVQQPPDRVSMLHEYEVTPLYAAAPAQVPATEEDGDWKSRPDGGPA